MLSANAPRPRSNACNCSRFSSINSGAIGCEARLRVEGPLGSPGNRVANSSLEVIDLDSGKRAVTLGGLRGPKGVAVAGGFVYVVTGGDGKLHRFDTRSLVAGKSVDVGDDADNVRVARDGKIWVSFANARRGGLAAFSLDSLDLDQRIDLPRMPEGFQLHPNGVGMFANLPAGKRSAEEGSVFGLKRPKGETLWERKLSAREGNFPMTLDPANDRVFIVARNVARVSRCGSPRSCN